MRSLVVLVAGLAIALGLGLARTSAAPPPIGSVAAGSQAPAQPSTTAQPGQPTTPVRARRPGEPSPKSTGIIRGQVTVAGTDTPVRRAQVRVAGEMQAGGVTSTDNEGRYEVKELPAGRYTVMVSKGGFTTTAYGQRRPNTPGTPIELSDGQMAERVNIALSRGGVVSGTITDEFGEPLSAVQVTAMRYVFSGGKRRMQPAFSEGGNDRTDDQGSFRLYGLPPGDYYVSAASPWNTNFSAPGTTNTTSNEGYAPTYYPGTPSIAEAQRVTVRSDQEMQNASFALTPARLSRLKGRAVNTQGEPAIGSMVMVSPRDEGGGMSMRMTGMVRSDGSFEVGAMPPGRYTVSVRPMGPPQGDASPPVGRLDVTLSGEDLDNLTLVVGHGAVARGRFDTDTDEPLPFKPQQLRLLVQPADPDEARMGGIGLSRPKVNDDLSFEATGLLGRMLLRFSTDGPQQGAPWRVKAVLRGNEDVTDTGIDFQPGRTIEDIVMMMTQKRTELSGIVTDDRNRPVTDAFVVAFHGDKTRWTTGTRWIRLGRPDTQARFKVTGLPPSDDYFVIAVQNLEDGQWSDPSFLETARDAASRFALREDEKKTLDVKIVQIQP